MVQLAKSALAEPGHVMLIVNVLLQISTLIGCSIGCDASSCTGMNVGACECNATLDPAALPLPDLPWQPLRACALSQRCNTLAFMAWAPAIAVIDVPGTWQAATSSALNSGL